MDFCGLLDVPHHLHSNTYCHSYKIVTAQNFMLSDEPQIQPLIFFSGVRP